MIRHQVLSPILFFLLGTALMVALYLFNTGDEQANTYRETAITAEQIQRRLESCVNSRLSLVRALAEQSWRDQSHIMAEWENVAASLFPLFTGIQALNYIDSARRIRTVYPLAGNESALNFDLTEHPSPSVPRALDAADFNARVARTDILELVQSGAGFALYYPITLESGAKAGFVNGVFRVDDLVSNCLSEEILEGRYLISLSEIDRPPFYQRPRQGTPPPGSQVNLDMDIVSVPWRLHFSPTQQLLEERGSLIDEAWFAFGMLLTTILSFMLFNLIRKQESLKQSQDNYRLLVENQSDMVVKVNMDHEFQYVSPSFCEMFGVREEYLIGKSFLPLVHEEDQSSTLLSLHLLEQPPYSSYHEQRALTPSGWRIMAWSNAGVLDEHGKVVEITAVGRDITEQKKLEARIAHAQKMQVIGEMAGGITHDFNNVLQVISGNIEFLIDDARDDKKAVGHLTKIIEVIERAKGLARKLSTLSKQTDVKPEIIDLNIFIGEILELLKRTLPGSISLNVERQAGALYVNADKTQLEQVMLNLCFNARDAIVGAGEISISLAKKAGDSLAAGLVPEPLAAEYASIRIVDNGSGIEESVIPRIFDPFFTTRSATTGTGLGLSNSYSIVSDFGGTITVESQQNQGSSFWIYLPLTRERATLDMKLPESQAAETSGEGIILIADDNPEILELTRKILEGSGFQTMAASNGEEAIAVFEANRGKISLLLIDLVMPEMDGSEAIRRLQDIDPAIKVLIISGYIPEDRQGSISEDIPVLKKPFLKSELVSMIRKLLDS